jgi:hypothetical protein
LFVFAADEHEGVAGGGEDGGQEGDAGGFELFDVDGGSEAGRVEHGGVAGEEGGGVDVGAHALLDDVEGGDSTFGEVEVAADIVGVEGGGFADGFFGVDAVDVFFGEGGGGEPVGVGEGEVRLGVARGDGAFVDPEEVDAGPIKGLLGEPGEQELGVEPPEMASEAVGRAARAAVRMSRRARPQASAAAAGWGDFGAGGHSAVGTGVTVAARVSS